MVKVKKRKSAAAGSESEGSDYSTIAVTFDFFDLDAVDYHALKYLISQLFSLRSFSSDSTASTAVSKAAPRPVPGDIDVGELADLILGPQKEWVGATVKCDGQDQDPYAVATVLDMRFYQDKPSMSNLCNHLKKSLKSYSDQNQQQEASQMLEKLETLLVPGQPSGGVGLVLSERLVNMPLQLAPPLLKQLGDEIDHAKLSSAPAFDFTHLLIPSRIFVASESSLKNDEQEQVTPSIPSGGKKKKAKTSSTTLGLGPKDFLYHPEDDIISKYSLHTVHYTLPTQGDRDDESFGVEQRGRLMLMEYSRWSEMIAALETYVNADSAMQVE